MEGARSIENKVARDWVSSIRNSSHRRRAVRPPRRVPCVCLKLPSPFRLHHPGRWVGSAAKNLRPISNSPPACADTLFLRHALLFCKMNLPRWCRSHPPPQGSRTWACDSLGSDDAARRVPGGPSFFTPSRHPSFPICLTHFSRGPPLRPVRGLGWGPVWSRRRPPCSGGCGSFQTQGSSLGSARSSTGGKVWGTPRDPCARRRGLSEPAHWAPIPARNLAFVEERESISQNHLQKPRKELSENP